MSLLAVIAALRERYALNASETTALATEVAAHVDCPLTSHPPMPVGLARKLGVRTYREAVRRVLAERLLGDPSEWPTVSEAPTPLPSPPARPSGIVARRRSSRACSLCRLPGHYAKTCQGTRTESGKP